MHVRWSAVQGMPIVDDETQDIVGFLTDPLIDPDTGRILGFFVAVAGEWNESLHFLSVSDILAWGTKIHVRSAHKLSPVDELIRLRKHLDDSRTFLGQVMRIRGSGRTLGRCADIQFDTRQFAVEWLFPKRCFFFRQPVSSSEILEVTARAIWIQDALRPVKERIEEKKEAPVLAQIPDRVPLTRGGQTHD